MTTPQNNEDIFRVHVLGVGNYFSKRHRSTSFVVQAGTRMILLEAPNDVFKRVEDYRNAAGSWARQEGRPAAGLENLVVDSIDHYVVTHDHGDHSAGVEAIGFYKLYVQRKKGLQCAKPVLYGTSGVIDDIRHTMERKFCRDGNTFDSFFRSVHVDQGSAVNIFPLRMEVFRNYHGMPGFAVMFSYRGRSVAYSGDTRFDSTLIGFLSKADVLLHECDGKDFVHTTPENLIGWLARSRYDGRLYVCHFPDSRAVQDAGLTPLEENTFIDI